jgi:acyl-CoA thioester hydrolase
MKKDLLAIYKLRIYIEDTDAGGVVYHANFLKFFERARTEMFRPYGFTNAQLLKEHAYRFVVFKADLKFVAPAFLDDALEVHSFLSIKSPVQLRFVQTVRRGEKELAHGTIGVTCVNDQFKPTRLPTAILSCLTDELK